MERFIASIYSLTVNHDVTFKIQYGEIYSLADDGTGWAKINLKSSMERFIEKAIKRQ